MNKRKVNYKNIKEGIIIDIRSISDYKKFHLENSINYPKEYLEANYETLLNKKTKYYLICYVGKSSNTLSKKIRKENYNISYIKGGYKLVKKLLKQ